MRQVRSSFNEGEAKSQLIERSSSTIIRYLYIVSLSEEVFIYGIVPSPTVECKIKTQMVKKKLSS